MKIKSSLKNWKGINNRLLSFKNNLNDNSINFATASDYGFGQEEIKREIKNIENIEIKEKPSKDFMSYFVGFMDGDGYFDISPQKQTNKKTKEESRTTIRLRLASNLHSRDISLLEKFQKELKVGTLSKMSSLNGKRDQVRIIFSRRDLINVIIPLMKEYNLKILTYQRQTQYNLLNYILDNNLTHWDMINKDQILATTTQLSLNSLINTRNSLDFKYFMELPQFLNWLVGFSEAEASFGIKKDNSAFYNIRQTGIENLELIKAIKILIKGKIGSEIKADSSNSYQISFSSKKDIQTIINFFSFSNNYPLSGYKKVQYDLWITNLKNNKRYCLLNLPS